MQVRSYGEEADVPDAVDEQVLDQVGHADHAAFRVVHADQPFLLEGPVGRRRRVELLLRGVGARRLAFNREMVFGVLLEEALQRRQIARVQLGRGRRAGGEKRAQAACALA
jgi:hypothetical protein